MLFYSFSTNFSSVYNTFSFFKITFADAKFIMKTMDDYHQQY